jgi:hypothetical protein
MQMQKIMEMMEILLQSETIIAMFLYREQLIETVVTQPSIENHATFNSIDTYL